MIWFIVGPIVGLIVGFIIGFLFFVYGQLSIERGYVRNKIVKLDGGYYRISPINKVEEEV